MHRLLPYINLRYNIFSLVNVCKAKEKDAKLDLNFRIDAMTSSAYPGALPLKNNDIFSCDRYKLTAP